MRSPSLKGNVSAGEKAQRHLAQIEGVTSVAVNPGAGSLLQYDTAALAPESVSDVLAAHGYTLAAPEEGAGPR